MTLLDSVPPKPAADQPVWLAELRRDAAVRLKEGGLPTRKVESWRFTPVAAVTRGPRDVVPSVFTVTGDAQTGVQVMSLTEALTGSLAELVRQELGQHVTSEHFAALNSSLFSDGLVVHIEAGANIAEPITVAHAVRSADVPSAAYPRLLVIAESSSEAMVVESFDTPGTGSLLVSGVTEIVVRSDARMRHIRIAHDAGADQQVSALGVHQEAGSSFESHVSTLGGGLSRLDLGVVLAGAGADCSLAGVYHAGTGEAGTGELVDHHVRVDHVEPSCSSQVRYRGLVDGNGHAVFDVTTVVRRDAQKTEAHQENRNLLLSDSAGVNTKPHLEIDADDIVASHGATVGDLDEEQLFYLRTRGIGEHEARAILTYAFVKALVDDIPADDLRETIASALLALVPNGDAIAEVAS